MKGGGGGGGGLKYFFPFFPIHTVHNVYSSDWKISVTNRDGSILVLDLMRRVGDKVWR